MSYFTKLSCVWFLIFLESKLTAEQPKTATPEFKIQLQSVKSLEGKGNDIYAQSRMTMIGKKKPIFLITTQHTIRNTTHGYRNIFQVTSDDFGKTWSVPKKVASLDRVANKDGYEVVMGDLCPQWHEKTGTVLVTGKSFNFENNKRENFDREKVTYSIYDPKTKHWSKMKVMGMPTHDKQGRKIVAPNAGCNQKVHLKNGEVLLPVRYNPYPVFKTRKQRLYITVVARCRFDGKTLKYVEHGSELTIKKPRGLYEPSLIEHRGKYFLTMRADHTAYVSVSKNGLDYQPIKQWKFDDGKPLGNYNTQQHWISNKNGLYLCYTRRGKNNGHVFRHRAPLYIAQVNPKTLQVIRKTEKILVPEAGATLGNFGICHVSPNEAWVITSEDNTRHNGKVIKRKQENRVWIAKVKWNAK